MAAAAQVSAIAFATLAMSSSLFAQQHNHADHKHESHGHDHPAMKQGPNGGTIQMVGTQRIETVIRPKGIMFMVLDGEGKTVAAPRASGSLKLRVGDKGKEYPYELKPLKNNAIGVGVDLSKVVGHTLHMDVTLNGIAAQPVSFHAMGQVGEAAVWKCPMHPQIRSATNETRCPICSMALVRGLPESELVKLQGTCPVSGKQLESMGTPPMLTVDNKTIFVCCASCSDRVKASPQQYLEKYYQSKGEQLRPGVFKATLADANAIAAQKLCPVMDKPLGKVGAPLKVDVQGKAVYICCAGCCKKLNANQNKFLAKLDRMGVTLPAME